MRRLALAAWVLLFVGAAGAATQQGMGPGPGMPASSGGGSHAMTLLHVYSCGSTANFATNTVCTITATTAGSSVLFAYSIYGGAAPTSISPACTYTLTGVANSNGTNWSGACLIENLPAGTTSVTLTYSTTYTESSIVVAELGGLVTSGLQDASVGLTEGAYSGTVNTGSVTSTNANDAIIGIVAAGPSAFTVGSGYTLLGSSTVTTASTVYVEYQNVAATGAYNPGFTDADNYPAIGTWAVKLQ